MRTLKGNGGKKGIWYYDNSNYTGYFDDKRNLLNYRRSRIHTISILGGTPNVYSYYSVKFDFNIIRKINGNL